MGIKGGQIRVANSCGFLAFETNSFRDSYEQEATVSIRKIIAADGKAGWFDHERAVVCYKKLWDWDDNPPVVTITYEANRPRFSCPGFYRYAPGRDPQAHLALEDERRGYRYQRRLAWLAFGGALLGAVVGAIGKTWITGD